MKRLDGGSDQGEREFATEVELLSRLHHRHLVGLLGFCEGERGERGEEGGGCLMLVYEFMSNGTLRHALHGEIWRCAVVLILYCMCFRAALLHAAAACRALHSVGILESVICH